MLSTRWAGNRRWLRRTDCVRLRRESFGLRKRWPDPTQRRGTSPIAFLGGKVVLLAYSDGIRKTARTAVGSAGLVTRGHVRGRCKSVHGSKACVRRVTEDGHPALARRRDSTAQRVEQNFPRFCPRCFASCFAAVQPGHPCPVVRRRAALPASRGKRVIFNPVKIPLDACVSPRFVRRVT
jgi:hypothetical protein